MRQIVGTLVILAGIFGVQRGYAATISATIVDFAFDPTILAIKPGDTVIWTNSGQKPHTVTSASDGFDSATIAPGSSFSHTFTRAGTFEYVCTIHSQMSASVVVAELAPAVQSIPNPAQPGLPSTSAVGQISWPWLGLAGSLLGLGALLLVNQRRAIRQDLRRSTSGGPPQSQSQSPEK